MRLKELREEHDVKQNTIASVLNIQQNTYSQYENEVRQIPLNLLVKLALYFDTSTDYILELTDESRPYPRKK